MFFSALYSIILCVVSFSRSTLHCKYSEWDLLSSSTKQYKLTSEAFGNDGGNSFQILLKRIRQRNGGLNDIGRMQENIIVGAVLRPLYYRNAKRQINTMKRR